MAKGRSAGHRGDIAALIGQSHLQISTDDRDEFSAKEVADKIKKAAGANYDRARRAPTPNTPAPA